MASGRLRHGRISIVLTAIAGSWFASCTLHTSYRHYPSHIDLPSNVKLAVVELDDHGELWDRPQLDRALGTIDSAQALGGNGAIVVTFVHGWNNNASRGNEWDPGGALHKFKDTLVTIAQRERELAGEAAQRAVVGIYVAWRGESIHPKPVALLQDVFTFYSRYGAAKKVAAGPAITETLLAIAATARANAKTQSIIVGHSFGGLIVEKALSQVIVQVATHEAYKTGPDGGFAPVGLAKFPADLIVLVNPASPALFARSEVSAIEQWRLQLADKMDARFVCPDNDSRRPILVSITSVGDTATGTWFPVGTKIGYSLERFRDYKYDDYHDPNATTQRLPIDSPPHDQKYFYTHTEGHVQELLSHTLEMAPVTSADGTVHPCSDDPCKTPNKLCFISGKRSFTLTHIDQTLNRVPEDPRVPGLPHGFSPYWIMQAPQTIIENHGDIFNSTFVDLLAGLVVVTKPPLAKKGQPAATP